MVRYGKWSWGDNNEERAEEAREAVAAVVAIEETTMGTKP